MRDKLISRKMKIKDGKVIIDAVYRTEYTLEEAMNNLMFADCDNCSALNDNYVDGLDYTEDELQDFRNRGSLLNNIGDKDIIVCDSVEEFNKILNDISTGNYKGSSKYVTMSNKAHVNKKENDSTSIPKKIDKDICAHFDKDTDVKQIKFTSKDRTEVECKMCGTKFQLVDIPNMYIELPIFNSDNYTLDIINSMLVYSQFATLHKEDEVFLRKIIYKLENNIFLKDEDKKQILSIYNTLRTKLIKK